MSGINFSRYKSTKLRVSSATLFQTLIYTLPQLRGKRITPKVFSFPADLLQAGEIRVYDVSVEKVEEDLKEIAYPNAKNVHITFTLFRLRQRQLLFTHGEIFLALILAVRCYYLSHPV